MTPNVCLYYERSTRNIYCVPKLKVINKIYQQYNLLKHWFTILENVITYTIIQYLIYYISSNMYILFRRMDHIIRALYIAYYINKKYKHQRTKYR